MRAGKQDALRDRPPVGRRVQHLEAEIREALDEDAEELDPGVAVERHRPDALGRVRNVVGGSFGAAQAGMPGGPRISMPWSAAACKTGAMSGGAAGAGGIPRRERGSQACG